jgi:hypothetical protein
VFCNKHFAEHGSACADEKRTQEKDALAKQLVQVVDAKLEQI